MGPIGSGLPLNSEFTSNRSFYTRLSAVPWLCSAPIHLWAFAFALSSARNTFPSEFLTPGSHTFFWFLLRWEALLSSHPPLPSPFVLLYFSPKHITMWHSTCLFSVSLHWSVSTRRQTLPCLRSCVSAPGTLTCLMCIWCSIILVKGLNTLSVRKFSSNGFWFYLNFLPKLESSNLRVVL